MLNFNEKNYIIGQHEIIFIEKMLCLLADNDYSLRINNIV